MFVLSKMHGSQQFEGKFFMEIYEVNSTKYRRFITVTQKKIGIKEFLYQILPIMLMS